MFGNGNFLITINLWERDEETIYIVKVEFQIWKLQNQSMKIQSEQILPCRALPSQKMCIRYNHIYKWSRGSEKLAGDEEDNDQRNNMHTSSLDRNIGKHGPACAKQNCGRH